MGIKKEESSWEKPADSRKQKRKRRKRRSKGLVEEVEGKTKFKEVSLKGTDQFSGFGYQHSLFYTEP